jgi:hypothetical protein
MSFSVPRQSTLITHLRDGFVDDDLPPVPLRARKCDKLREATCVWVALRTSRHTRRVRADVPRDSSETFSPLDS